MTSGATASCECFLRPCLHLLDLHSSCGCTCVAEVMFVQNLAPATTVLRCCSECLDERPRKHQRPNADEVDVGSYRMPLHTHNSAGTGIPTALNNITYPPVCHHWCATSPAVVLQGMPSVARLEPASPEVGVSEVGYWLPLCLSASSRYDIALSTSCCHDEPNSVTKCDMCPVAGQRQVSCSGAA